MLSAKTKKRSVEKIPFIIVGFNLVAANVALDEVPEKKREYQEAKPHWDSGVFFSGIKFRQAAC